MFRAAGGQALVEYLFAITVISISLLAIILLSQDALSMLYNYIASVIQNNL